MADEAERRREFAARAPELRAAAVVELLELTRRAAGLSPDEIEVLRHVAARAGYALDGFHIPELAALWGGAGDSYFPAAPLPAQNARAAAHFLRRRGILRPEGGGVFVVLEALSALAAAPSPAAKAKAPKRKTRVKSSLKKRRR
ncbi:MAG TPA: hypothetical protein VH309_10425 [Elusimicrobiota bacterium]|nr:hypothetical protein [Elusimicrobiota bacterium]